MNKIFLTFLITTLFAATGLMAQCPPPGYPAPGDMCVQAPVLCADLDGYCDILDANNVPQGFPGCPSNALNNDEWFGFIAGSTTISILVTPSNCQGVGGQFGMQGAIYEGGCNGAAVATQCGCTQNPFTMTYNNFIVGQAYYIVFDGCGGDICDYVVNVLQGSTLPTPPQTPGLVSGPANVCPGAIVQYSVPNPNAATYTWTITPPNLGTFVGSNMGTPVTVNWTSAGMATICVTSSNPCFTNPTPSCMTVNSQPLPPQTQTYNLCVGQCKPCAGVQFCAPTPPAGTPVTLQSWLGCDSVIICKMIGIPPIQTNVGQVNFCAPATYTVCGTTYNTSGIYSKVCTSWQGCDSTVIVDLAIMAPDANILPPAVLGCGANATVLLNGTTSSFNLVPGGNTTFLWTGPGIVGPTNDVLATVNQPGQYCLTVTHSRGNVTCSNTECVTVTQNNAVPQMPSISGNQNPCQGTTVTYTITPNGTPAPTGYTVTSPNGEPVTMITATTYSVNWNSAAGGQLCVTANNACGSSPPACIPITIAPAAAQPTVTGPGSVCANSATQTYTVSSPQPGVTYNWTVPAGASISGSGSSINVNYSGTTPGSGQVCVTAMNACNTSQPGCVAVIITAPPIVPVLSGPNSACTSGSYNYTVTNPQAGSTYNWTAPTGATITGSGTTVGISFNGASTGQVCVATQNSCGTSNQTCQNVTVIPAPTATISGGGSFCQGSGTTVDLTITLSGTGPWDVEYTINNGTPIPLNITTSPYTLVASQAGTYELTSLALAGSACPGTVSGTATVTENPLPTAALSGSGSICQGSGQQAALTIDLTGTAPWTVTWMVGANSQAPLVINTSPYTLNIGQAQAGNITLTGVTGGNGCIGTVSGSATVVVNTAPTVSMVETPCDATNTLYTVSFVISGGNPATYSVTPANGTLTTSPPYTFTSTPIPHGTGYSFVVNDANNCNPVTVSQNIVVCNCTTDVGSMSATPVEECGDGPVTVPYDTTGQAFDGNDVLVFILHSGNSVNVVSPIISVSSTPVVSFNPATMTYGTTYYLSAVVGDDDGAGGVDLNDPCLKVAQGTPVTFYEIPTAALSGTPVICQGSPANLSVAFTGVAPFSISYDDGTGNIQTVNGITSNPYTLTVNPTSTTTYCLTASGDDNCVGTFSGCGTVTVNTAVQVTPAAIACDGTNTSYTVTFTISGGDPASYAVTGIGGNISATAPYVFTSDPIASGMGYNITVNDANGCGPKTLSLTQHICSCTSNAGIMAATAIKECGDGPVNAGDATGTVLDANDLHIYYLHTNNGTTLGTVIAISATPSFSFNAATMTYGTTYYISSVVGSDDGTGTVDLTNDICLSVSAGTPVTFFEVPTAVISGSTEVCPGESAALSIDLTGDSPWSITINGQAITGIVNSPYTYTVTPATTTTYDLTAVSDENCANTATGSETVTVHQPPTISNDTTSCNTTNTGFTLCFDINGGDASCYQVTPAGGTITGNLYCSPVLPNGQGYNYQVTDCHGCPAVVVQSAGVLCNCTSLAGAMANTPLSICGTDTAQPVYLGGEVFDGDDVLCYMLHNGDGVPILTNTTGIFSYQAGTLTYGTQYFISAVVGNDNGSGCVDFTDPCKSIGAGAPVRFHAIPTAVLSGDASICNGSSTNLSVVLTGVGPWTIVYKNAAGNNVTVTANSSPHAITVSPPASNVYSLISVQDANCAGTVSGSALVNVNAPPQVVNLSTLCNPNAVNYTVSFEIVGGDNTSYTVSPAGTLTSGTFTSNPIINGTAYSFSVDDANACGPTIVNGVVNCPCLTDAGTMSTMLQNFCADQTATVAPTTGQNLDPDDVLIYVLHTSSGTTLGTILATSPTPNFTFMPGLTLPNQQYYISAVAGNNNGSGGVVYTHACTDVAPGTPIIFRAVPTITIAGTTSICEGETAPVTINMTGTGPYTVSFLVNSVPQTVTGVPSPLTINQPWATTTTITLVSVTDQASGCMKTANQSVTITVNNKVEAGTATGDFTVCQGAGAVLNLNSQLTGADPNGQWTSSTGTVIPGGNLNTGTLGPNTYTFTYTVNGTPPCPNDQASLKVIVNPQPAADAGPDKLLDCDVTTATLGGSGTTPGVTYAWTGGNVSDPTIAQPTTTEKGTYTLTVTGAGGCSATDVVVVNQNVTDPLPFITISDVSCFGKKDGFIVLDSIKNGTPPYLCSIDGSPFSTQKQFTGMSPGSHSIVIQDAGGCETTLNFLIAEPEQVIVNIEGSFEGDDPLVQLGESVVLQIVTNPAFALLDTVIWSPDSLVSCINCQQNEVTLNGQTTFSVTVAKDGCKADDQLTVFVKKDRPVFVPNAFSPNEDGRNDLFSIYGGKSVAKIKSFQVFNRWGETVYQFFNFPPNDPSIGWNGFHRGKLMRPGVFTWFAEVEFVDGEVEIYEGDVTLMR